MEMRVFNAWRRMLHDSSNGKGRMYDREAIRDFVIT
jgi:hypothetical protein